MTRSLFRSWGLLAVFLVLGGCATSGAFRVPKLPKGETLTVLSLLPDAASVVIDDSTFSPDRVRLFPTGAWHINALDERWAIRALGHRGQFRVIDRPLRKIRRHFGVAQPRSSLRFSRPGRTVRQLVASAGTDLVLVIGPSHGVEEGASTAAPLMMFGAIGGAISGVTTHFIGTGYGVSQGGFLDTRSGFDYVALRMWLLDGRTGTVIAKTRCRKYLVRFSDGKTNPKVKALWIHWKGPVSGKNWSSVHAEIRVLMKKTEASCLRNLNLA
jgi:hypothetical protein